MPLLSFEDVAESATLWQSEGCKWPMGVCNDGNVMAGAHNLPVASRKKKTAPASDRILMTMANAMNKLRPNEEPSSS